PHPGVDDADDQPPAREAGQGQQRPGRDAQDQADQGGQSRNLERQKGDGEHFRVKGENQGNGLGYPFEDQIHQSPSDSGFFPASGKKSGLPNLSTPNPAMSSWAFFDTMKSAKALAPAVFTLGHLAGFTSITW